MRYLPYLFSLLNIVTVIFGRTSLANESVEATVIDSPPPLLLEIGSTDYVPATPSAGHAHWTSYSPDGSRLAVGPKLHVIRVDDGADITPPEVAGVQIEKAAWLTDNQLAILETSPFAAAPWERRFRVRVMDLSNEVPTVWRAFGGQGWPCAIAWMGNSVKAFFSAEYDGNIRLPRSKRGLRTILRQIGPTGRPVGTTQEGSMSSWSSGSVTQKELRRSLGFGRVTNVNGTLWCVVSNKASGARWIEVRPTASGSEDDTPRAVWLTEDAKVSDLVPLSKSRVAVRTEWDRVVPFDTTPLNANGLADPTENRKPSWWIDTEPARPEQTLVRMASWFENGSNGRARKVESKRFSWLALQFNRASFHVVSDDGVVPVGRVELYRISSDAQGMLSPVAVLPSTNAGVSFSPDGRNIIVGARRLGIYRLPPDHTLDETTATLTLDRLNESPAPDVPAECIALSPDESRMAAGGLNVVDEFDLETGRRLVRHTLAVTTSVKTAAYRERNGHLELLVGGFGMNQLTVVGSNANDSLDSIPVDTECLHVRSLPDGQLLVVAANRHEFSRTEKLRWTEVSARTKSARIYPMAGGEPTVSVELVAEGLNATLCDAASLPPGSPLFRSLGNSRPSTIHVGRNGELMRLSKTAVKIAYGNMSGTAIPFITLKLESERSDSWESESLPVDSKVACSADGRVIAASDSEGTIRVWYPSTKRPVYSWKLPHPKFTSAATLALTPSGRKLVVGASDTTIRVYELNK